MAKLRIGLLFGGRSVEHDVSIVSAASILGALDRNRYEISLIGVDTEGAWHLAGVSSSTSASSTGASATSDPSDALTKTLREPRVILPATAGSSQLQLDRRESRAPADFDALSQIDVLFPILHGRGGEDGALQGLLELAEIPYVGSGVLSSALQMDKDLAKRLLSQAGLPVTPWQTFGAAELDHLGLPAAADRITAELGLPVYIKPANSGSSVGIALAENQAEVVAALADALRYDRKVIAEVAIDAREIEVAVLGNDSPEASVPGEIRAQSAFYDYEAKYKDDTTELIIPADLDEEQAQTLRSTAVTAYQTLGGEGLARVDFLVDRGTGAHYINELNSLPGFTNVSMYPKLWEATGLPYPKLLDRLIELAIERHAERSKLETRAPAAGN